MILLTSALIVLISGSVIFYIICILSTWQFCVASRSVTTCSATHSENPVSILVPICGLDVAAWQNWSSLCKQNYSTYEVLFGVVDPQDPAVPLLRQLTQRFSDHTRLLVGLEPRGINHKDSTLTYLLEQAQSEIIIFADSDIQVSPDYIQMVVAPLANPEVGLVTCLYMAHDPQFLWASVAALGRCCDFIPSMLVAQMLDRELRFAIGVTLATRKATLEAIGGLHLNRIGSDYNLGKRVAQAGYRVELSHYILESDTGRENVWQLVQRELRWARTIRFNRGPIYYGQIFCHGTIYSAFLLVVSIAQPWTITLAVITWSIRYIQAIAAIFNLNNPRLLRWLWILPVRDLLSFVIFVTGGFGRCVYWRGRKLQIERDGLIREG
jgi:ceramide glucosyltransferase